MKKITFRILGIIALILGAYYLYNVVSNILYSSESMNLFAQVGKVALAWVAIYGGYQTIRLNASGKRLLLIYFMLIIFRIMLSFVTIAYAVIKAGENLLELLQHSSFLAYEGYLLFSTIATVLLLKNSTGVFETDIDTRHRKIVAKMLSQLMPGMGRAFLGNIRSGFALFLIYVILVSGHTYFSIGSIDLNSLGLLDIAFGLVVWKIFAGIDWEFVKTAERPPDGSSPSSPVLFSEPRGG